jgi:predicted AlkP superfamily pyrophosphatase or phosphodiesterase
MSRAPLVVLDIVGLTPSLVGEHTPHLKGLADEGFMAPVSPILPAVTCSAQSTLLTGKLPSEHGIVGNGWYFRETAEVRFWLQNNGLVQSDKLWDAARAIDPALRSAVHFWWYNMYSSADLSVTLRPIYPADGRKIPALYSRPDRLQSELQGEHGNFPMFDFWGPRAGLPSSQWIAESAATLFSRERPDLLMVYLPHLDYSFQRLGPSDPGVIPELQAIDAIAGRLIERVRAEGAEVAVVSEYGIEDATKPIGINQVLRDAGLIAVRETLGWELLDPGASEAFAVCDHQVAHVYIQDKSKVAKVKELLEKQPGIDRVLQGQDLAVEGLDHARSGELVAVAAEGHWFHYYYWLDEDKAPDFARTVDIHRKPGYDPVELFLDPDRPLIKAHLLKTLAKKKLGFRYMMDVIPLRPDLVKGSHGRRTSDPNQGPILICSNRQGAKDAFAMTEIHDFLLGQLGRTP